jgi:hypothetical protein
MCIYFIGTVFIHDDKSERREGRRATTKRTSGSASSETSFTVALRPFPSKPSQVDPHRSHLTSSAVMLCEVPEDTELERNADVALEDKALIGAWSDLRA